MGDFSPWGGGAALGLEPPTLVTLGLMALVMTFVWVWTRAGQDKYVDLDPSVGERVEDFAGVIRETGGRFPLFIWLIIGSVVGFITWYLLAVTVGGYKY
jgi:hypothetical protein